MTFLFAGRKLCARERGGGERNEMEIQADVKIVRWKGEKRR
jgi:hypothetical protein